MVTYQNIDILADIALRVCLDNLLDGRPRIEFLPSCHYDGRSGDLVMLVESGDGK
jgi:hypothetical protein